MADSVLPMSIEKMEEINKEDEVQAEQTAMVEEVKEEVVEEVEDEPAPKKEIFEAPVVETKKPRKKRKPMSEEQKEKLAKAREISAQRRKAVKEAKMIEKESHKMARKKKLEEKLEKKMEDEALIQYKAKIMADAKANSGWSEEKLMGLMTRTIDNYIEKKKASKPQPRVSIPNKAAYPQYSPMAQQPHLHQQQNYYPQQPPPPQRTHKSDDPYHTLFGFTNT
jgi:hypothetical protein